MRQIVLLCLALVVVCVKADWRSDANQRIEQLRTVSITVKASGSGTADVELKLKRNGFFGSCVDARMIVDSQHRAYQDVFYKNFAWGVLENALKWQWMEQSQGNVDYNTPLTAMQAMSSHGIKLRCHCVFWDKDENNAGWVKNLNGDSMKQAISTRINGVVGKTRGMCEHWDVNNENLHGQFYEQHTGDNRITQKMFEQIHQADSKPKLFINDYNVLAELQTATRLRDLAKQYKSEGVPIGGVGIQGHIRNIDVNTIKSRVELVAEAGIPIWITELGVNNNNVNARAQDLVDTLTMFYSLPAVEGVILWGFWDGRIWETDAAMYEGNSVTPNAAGRAFEDLLFKTWGTDVTKSLSSGESFNVKGHKGQYEVNVKQNGRTITTQSFDADSSKTVTVELSGSSANVMVG